MILRFSLQPFVSSMKSIVITSYSIHYTKLYEVLSPELLKILMEMGHSDEIVIADGNFPSGTCAKRLIRCDGHNVPDVLDAILKFFPLDPYVEAPVRNNFV